MNLRAVFFFGTAADRLVLFCRGCDFLEGGLFTGDAQFRARCEDDAWRFDLGCLETFLRQAARRAQCEAKVTNFPELDNAPGAEIFVEAVVDTVNDRLYVGRSQRAGFCNVGAKLVERDVAAIDSLCVKLRRVLLGIIAQVPPFDKFVP